MKRTITVSEDGFELPTEELLTGRGFITGKSGSGKSNTASVIIEELLDEGFAPLIVDTDGEYYGLKEEYEILHVGADEECDIQVGEEHAEKLADLVLDGVPIILDVSGYLDEDDADAVIRETARQLFAKEKKQKQPLPVFVEEVHEYIPQTGALGDVGQMLVKVAKRGRKHGLGVVGISQRPANVQKDFITQANWLVWHRLTWDNDTEVVRRVVGKEQAEAVEDLADGEAFVQADFLDDIERVQFRRKRTFDAGATPGLDDFERPELKSVSGDLVKELEEISEQKRREQDRIAELEAELEEREERISELEDELERARDIASVAEEFRDAMVQSAGAGDDESMQAIEAEIDEIREEKNERIRELENENEELREERERLRERVAELEEYEERAEKLEGLQERRDELLEVYSRLGEALDVENGGDAEKWRERAESLREKVDDLEREVERLEAEGGGMQFDDEYERRMAFVEDEAVRDEIAKAAEKSKAGEKTVWDIVTALVDHGTMTTDDIKPLVDVSRSTVSGVLSTLHDHHIVARESGEHGAYEHSLNVDRLEEVVKQRKTRERMDEIREEIA